MNIGQKIRSQRLNQKRTLQEIADVCGFTRGLLSKIETGETMSPFATLTKIANALGVKVAAFLAENASTNKTVFVSRKATHPAKAIITSKGYGFIPIIADRIDKTMQPYIFTVR